MDRDDIIAALVNDAFTEGSSNGTADPAWTFDYAIADGAEPANFDPAGAFTWTAVTAAEADAFRAVLAEIETFANVTFTEVASNQALDFGKVVTPTDGFGAPAWSFVDGDLDDWVGYTVMSSADTVGDDARLLREHIGRLFGLESTDVGDGIDAAFDTDRYTVMSDVADANGAAAGGFTAFDILTLQSIWGANDDHATGNDKYFFNDDGVHETIWDAGGADRVIAQTGKTGVVFDVAAGTATIDGELAVSIAFDTEIERWLGSGGADTMIGGDGDDFLGGRKGMDTIEGGAGNDTIKGGFGNDTVEGGTGDDLVAGNLGKDVVRGEAGNDTVRGGKSFDRLFGGEGDDVLAGGKGKDQLFGGAGADSFVFRGGMQLETVKDYVAGEDMIDVDTAKWSIAEVRARAVDTGDDVRIDMDGKNIMIIEGVDISDLTFV